MQRPMGQATVEWYLKQHPRCFLMFPIANFTQIYLTDCFGYNYWSSWCQSLFSINSRYIRNQKAGRFILVLVHPKVLWCAYTCWNLWEPPPPPPPPPVYSICLCGPPTRGRGEGVKWNGLFWLVGKPSLSTVRLRKNDNVSSRLISQQ